MHRTLRLLRIGALGVAFLAVAALGTVYGVSQRELARTYDVPLSTFHAPSDAALLAEGERLARIRGCIGCHGADMEGKVFMDVPWLARIVAPDLPRVVREYSDAELERVIRSGVRRDGRGVWVMPSPMFYHLSDEDVGLIIAYLRSVESRGGPETEVTPRILARFGMATGRFPPLNDELDLTVARIPADRSDAIAYGRYLALTVCSECHGADLRGAPEDGVPDLRMAAAYDAESFTRLMRTGTGLGDRELGLMSSVARSRFSHFTDSEIEALHAYLRSLTAAGG